MDIDPIERASRPLPAWIWCVVGNIHTDQPSGEKNSAGQGTRRFSPGTMVYFYPEASDHAIRRQSTLVRSVIGIGCVEKLRVKQVHDGRVIEAMVHGWLSSEIAGSPCVYGWDDSDASAADARDRADVLEALAEVGGEHPSPDMEVHYANYIWSDDRMLERDGTVFYRIIERTTLPDCRSSGRLTLITVDSRVGGRDGDWYADEHGNRILRDCTETVCFRPVARFEVPTWFFRTQTLCICGELEDGFGRYLRLAELDSEGCLAGTPENLMNLKRIAAVDHTHDEPLQRAQNPKKRTILHFMNSFKPYAVAAGYADDALTGKSTGRTLCAYSYGGYGWDTRDIWLFDHYDMELDPGFCELATHTDQSKEQAEHSEV